MTINAAVLAAANATFQTIFDEKIKAEPGDWMKIAWFANIKGSVGKYPFTTTSSLMRAFGGEVQFRRVAAEMLTVEDQIFTDGLAVPKQILEDDQLDLVNGDIQDIAREGQRYKEQLLIATLLTGWSAIGFDKVAFFSNAHPRRNGLAAQDNDLAGANVDSTNFDAAVEALMSFTDEMGKPRGFKPTHIIYGAKQRAAVKSVIEAEVLASGASNTNYKAVERIETPYITGKHWFVADLSWAKRKPVIFQVRKEPEFIPPAANSDHTQRYLEYLYTIEARYAAALMDPLTIVGATGT